jgi:hypothetical protein
MVGAMDEGAPIAYEVLEKGVPVYASGGEEVGNVYYVLADEAEDIFHGIVVTVHGDGPRVVFAEDVASLHERGVDLRIDVGAVSSLSPPGGRAAVYREDPAQAKGWGHWLHKVGLRGDWKREG